MTTTMQLPIEELIRSKAAVDRAFRRRLVSDPRAVLEEEITQAIGVDVRLPADVSIRVVENTSDTIYIVLPELPAEPAGPSAAELAGIARGSGGVLSLIDCAS